MDGGKTWYLCDSEKNTACRRKNCWMCRRYGSRAIYESRQLQQPCNLTSRREYAMEDGQGRLIRVKIWKDRRRGFLCEFIHEEKEEDRKMAKVFTIAESVTELRQLLADGKVPEIGQIALSMNGMDWRCVEHMEENGVVLMMATAYDWRPFARPDKEHPWGWNNYEASQIRKELNSEVLTDLFGDEQDQLEYWEPGMGKLFLLSEEEAGFKQTEATFAWFRGSSESELERKRMLKDRDGDPAYWWLRSPNPSSAYGVRIVYSDGSLYYVTAYGGYCAVAACVISKS